ncbi:hypothetical protein TVAG_070650 [Trichomonas vaginalis G3]|uniref:Uncharacterized protein n=1 Tax=Trichomonas vaginalis (strain ATCC PRA-98 / G3) TaxID=412133 RepID=A2D7W9_TRIV3|nr:hypothetical protein TVAGG3_1045230 [Trichomonas vaginalis G3]EAY23402.1 hypothetical protein TVAG_070650 [Trichomonas vaginalis G3]KAI5493816.1 hypothetical protein TVAGG3_1045230 [Trichomonas vaginalis G3]|eukprot:XP_001584388.1 hypothetical protein [Trichomonas vaginalis G3]
MNLSISFIALKKIIDSPLISLNPRSIHQNLILQRCNFRFFAEHACKFNTKQISSEFIHSSFKGFLKTPLVISNLDYLNNSFRNQIIPECKSNIRIESCQFTNCTVESDGSALKINCPDYILKIFQCKFENCHSLNGNSGVISAQQTRSTAICKTCFLKCSAKSKYQIFNIKTESKGAFNISGIHNSGKNSFDELKSTKSYYHKICNFQAGTQRINTINSTHNSVNDYAAGFASDSPFEIDFKFANFGYLEGGFALERTTIAVGKEVYSYINVFHHNAPNKGTFYLHIFGSFSDSLLFNVTINPLIFGQPNSVIIMERCRFDAALINLRILSPNGIANSIVQYKECIFSDNEDKINLFGIENDLVCFNFNLKINLNIFQIISKWVDRNPHIVGFGFCLILSIISVFAYWKSKRLFTTKIPIAFTYTSVDKNV